MKHPIDQKDVSAVAADLVTYMRRKQRDGYNGLDVSLGAISALRTFTLENVGAEHVVDQLRELAQNVTEGV